MDAKHEKLLRQVGEAGIFYSTEKTMKPLGALVEGNPTMKNDAGEIAFRVSEQGKAALAELDKTNGSEGEGEGGFTIAAVPLPKIARGGGGGRPSKYPFDKLENGQSFFIPAGNGVKNPSKTYGSIVASANKRYGGERRFTTRSVTGDAWGQPGVKGVAVFRLSAEDEAAARAK